ncbi:MAG: type II secretion system F family protein [Candidatus Paceibacterota bacterium]|jgi:type IV pilus assembly protein PilC
MKFQFKAITISGNQQEGKIEATTQEKAIEILQRHKLVIVSIKPVREYLSLGKMFSFLHKVKREKIIMFSKELAVMLESGIPLVEALRILYGQEENEYFKEQIYSIASKVDDGMPFSSALAESPNLFSDFYINIVRAGEASGKLQETFVHLSTYMDKQSYLNAKLKNAMIYPVVVIAGFGVVGVGVMVFVMPQLVSVFDKAGQELPFTTKALISLSKFFQDYLVVIIVLSISFAYLLKSYISTPNGKKIFDAMILKIPKIKTILQKVYVSRFAGNLSMLIASGIPITDALKITGNIVGNNVYKELIFSSIDEVKIGGSVSYVFERSDNFPVVVSKMMRIGEKSGQFGKILQDISSFYEKEIDLAIEGIMALIEPVLIFVLGIGVLIFILSILQPIYGMTSTLS